MNKVAIIALMILFCLYSKAQVTINSVNYNTVSIGESNCLQAIVMNTSVQVTSYAEISVKNSNGEIIIEGKSRSFNLSSGINTISGSVIGFSRFTYGNNGKAQYLKNNGMLASGAYTYCLRIVTMGSEASNDIYCEEFESATEDFLNLVSPYDKEELDTKLPVLTWTHSEPFNALAKNEYFKIILVEMRDNQSKDQAVFSNPVQFSKNFLTTHAIDYPLDAKELEDGKHYAWQVQKISNNIIVNKTDVWEFSIKPKNIQSDLKYAIMKSTYDASYYTAINERVFFQFEEVYHGSDLDYTIYNTKRKVVKAELNNENTKGSNPELILKNHGNNKFELDLSPYHLKEGYYFLEIRDEKKRKSVLKFYVGE